MPKIHRAMRRAPDGLPETGDRSNQLGVRVPPNEHADIDVDGSGNVALNGKGLSVTAGWEFLQAHQIPKRLRDRFPGATGSDSLSLFEMGTGEFAADQLTGDLSLILKAGRSNMGLVTPSRPMGVADFQAALAATRDQWVCEAD